MVRKQVNLPSQFGDSHLAKDNIHRDRDTGCSLYPSCLECPLPECLHDAPDRGKHLLRREVRAERNRDIIEKFEAGWKAKDTARQLGLCGKTVQRVIKDYQRRIHERRTRGRPKKTG